MHAISDFVGRTYNNCFLLPTLFDSAKSANKNEQLKNSLQLKK